MISACFMQLVASLKYDLSGEDNWTWISLLLNPFCTPQRSGFKFSTELDLTMCVRNTDQKVSFHCPFLIFYKVNPSLMQITYSLTVEFLQQLMHGSWNDSRWGILELRNM